MAPTRAWVLAAALACALLVATTVVRPAGAEGGSPSPPPSPGAAFTCNPATDKTCKPHGVVLPSGGVDLDGDGDEDELPGFDNHLTILGHGH